MMQERIAEYVAKLQAKGIKGISGYELAARECSEYFDGRGIENPTKEDWTAFEEYYPQEYQRKKGRELRPITLKQNFVARGKAFYRWCNGEQTASLFEEGKTEAIRPPEAEAESAQQEAPAEEDAPSKRVNLLIAENLHSALMSLVYLKGQTLTAILTEAIKAYVDVYSEEIATLEETRRKLRSQ